MLHKPSLVVHYASFQIDKTPTCTHLGSLMCIFRCVKTIFFDMNGGLSPLVGRADSSYILYGTAHLVVTQQQARSSRLKKMCFKHFFIESSKIYKWQLPRGGQMRRIYVSLQRPTHNGSCHKCITMPHCVTRGDTPPQDCSGSQRDTM